MLAPDRIERLRRALLEEREAILQHLAAHDTSEFNTDEEIGVGNHMADDATEVFNQEAQLSLRLNQEYVLNAVERALERIDHGAYGVCERCGQAIDYARLKARPYAEYCMNCQRMVEAEA
jgi:DnaK suppressor protein